MKRTSDAAAVLALALTALPTLASASVPAAASKADAPLSRTLAAPVQSGWVQVIVKTAAPLTPEQRSQLTRLGAAVTRDLPIIRSLALRVPNANLSKLAALPFITHLSSDGTVTKSDEFTVASSGANLVYQYSSLNGSGVGIAVLDSGVEDHEDVQSPNGANRVVAHQDMVGGSYTRALDPVTLTYEWTYDHCGHGTHVAGIAAGNGHKSTGKNFYRTFYGIARGASIIDVTVLGQDGGGDVGTVISGIQWVIDHKGEYNIRVINLSLGHPVGESYTTDPLCQAVEAAWKEGITVVCAAGNYGRVNDTQAGTDNEGWGTAYGSISSPGNDPYVITVGATKSTDGKRADDRIATYSSRGPSRVDLILKPDLIAPGNRVISTEASKSFLGAKLAPANVVIPRSYEYRTQAKESSQYITLSGTSMAAPVVSGAVALLLQAYPTLTPDTLKARLMLSADKWTDPSGGADACTYGAGYLNIPAAFSSTVTVTGEYAVSPSLTVNPDNTVTVNDDHALWGNSGITSSHALWGNSLLWGQVSDLHALWGNHALWGTATLPTLTDQHALWGSSVWNDHALWGTTSDAVDLTSTALKGE